MKNLILNNIIIVLFLSLSSCKEDKNKENDMVKIDQNKKIMTLNISEIEKHIELQKRIESDEVEYDNPYELTIKDLELSFQIINEGLSKNGYKTPDLSVFKSFAPLNDKEWKYVKYFDTDCLDWKNDNIFDHFQLVDRDQFIFSSDKKFITDFFLLKEIIDIKIDNSYSIKIPEKIIHRNKYLFNNNKSSLVWLKFNDKYFAESLVKVFGYVEDKDLLKWVLDKNLNDDEFDKLLFTKTCDNKYVFHKEIFEIMIQADAKSKHKYLLYLGGRLDLPKVDDLNFSEATRINALYCYYATKFTTSIEPSDAYGFFPKLNEDKFEEEIKKNNYYNLPDFKKLYEDTRYGGTGLPM